MDTEPLTAPTMNEDTPSPPSGGNLSANRYAIWSKSEILHILNSIQEQNVLVNLSAETSGDVFLSSLIAVDDHNNTMVLDPSQNRAVNDRFVNGQTILFETMLDQVRVYFRADRAWHCLHGGEACLCLRIPESVIRLQRRDYYRVHLPSSKPVLCLIPPQVESGLDAPVSATVEDIGLGGIAVVYLDNASNIGHGTMLKNCRFTLPGIGEVSADLEVRNVTHVKRKSGPGKIRLGCRFDDIDNQLQNALQRYIIKLECERRAKLG